MTQLILTPHETFNECQMYWLTGKPIIKSVENKELDDEIQLAIKEGGEFELKGESFDDYLFLRENKTHVYINDCGMISLYKKNN